jgi:hypothetical protein
MTILLFFSLTTDSLATDLLIQCLPSFFDSPPAANASKSLKLELEAGGGVVCLKIKIKYMTPPY